jgi:hypothetical protein
MKIESPAFTMDDVRAFMSAYRDRERNLLADRLQRLSERVEELGPLVRREPGVGGEWNAQEILAHIAVVSKFYGVLVHRIASGKMQDFNLLEAVNLRDSAGQAMAEVEPTELVSQTIADHARTIKTLREADSESMRREARIEDGSTMTAEEVARMPLIGHLEMHIDQLEKMLGR